VGCTATIYWPQVDTPAVVRTASKLYGTHLLTAPDGNTLQCKVTRGVTYVPIPTGSGENFAGLLTVDLPPTVVKGQEFKIIVRRIRTRQIQKKTDVVIAAPQAAAGRASQTAFRNWRYVVGTFQVRIPVRTADVLLSPEENTLAVLKWRLQNMSPSNRWYPVLKRYIAYVGARVDGLGGDSTAIPPTLEGIPPKGVPGKDGRVHTGKVCEVLYDCFGDFDGFVLEACCNERHVFRSRQAGIGNVVLLACERRLTVSVWLDGPCGTICKIAIHR
jgi:hypothetical protein